MNQKHGRQEAIIFLKKGVFPTCIKHSSKTVTATLKISPQPFIPLNIPPV